MEKLKKFLSPAGQAKLTEYTRKKGTSVLYAVGIHVGETELFCTKAEQASGPRSAGLASIQPQSRKAEWKGITDFVVPPQWLDFLCAPGVTYKDALSSFIKTSVLEIIRKPANGAVVIACSFPVHAWWEGSDHAMQSLLDQLFSDQEWIIPAVVPIAAPYAERNEGAMVYAGKLWTTFYHGMKKYSVSFGSDTDFLCFRCNDYLNNSTREWTQKTYSSWEEGFLDICRTISGSSKGTKRTYAGFADKIHRGSVEKVLIGRNLASGPIAWKNPGEETLRIVLPGAPGPTTRKTLGPGYAKIRNEKEPTVKSSEDLFNW